MTLRPIKSVSGRLAFIAVLFLIPGIALSQATPVAVADNSVYWGTPVPQKNSINYSAVKGSAFHNDEFVRGLVVLENKDTLVRYLRYNAYLDEMEMIRNNRIVSLINPRTVEAKVDPTSIDVVYLNDLVYKSRIYLDYNGGLKEGYFIQLVDGESQLFKRSMVQFFGAQAPPTSFHDKGMPARFRELAPIYFYKRHGDVLKRFVNNKTVMADLFQLEWNIFSVFIIEHDLKLRKEEDLVKLFEYMNTAVER